MIMRRLTKQILVALDYLHRYEKEACCCALKSLAVVVLVVCFCPGDVVHADHTFSSLFSLTVDVQLLPMRLGYKEAQFSAKFEGDNFIP